MGILVRFFMKIAVTYDEDSEQIFQHFGHTEALKIYNIEDNKVISTKILSTEGHGHSVIADFLNDVEAKVLICGGIGPCAISALQEYGIVLCAGISGSADEAVDNFLKGTLDYQTGANCNHHGEHHSCGSCNH